MATLPPAPSGTSGGGAIPPVEEEEEDDGISPLDKKRLERTIDLYWMKQPQDYENRQYRHKFVRKVISRMPVVLKRLAPASAFDPREAWRKEKECRTAAGVAAAEAKKKEEKKAAKKGGGGGGGGGKKKRRRRRQEIIAKNKDRMGNKELSVDMERLDNAAVSAKKGLLSDLHAVKPNTEIGALRKLLMILSGSVGLKDKAATYDVLWAIESNPLFHKGDAEVSEKKDKKEKDKKEAPLSLEGKLVYEHRKNVQKARGWRDEEKDGMVQFQLNFMNDRLPPLSIYNRTFKLDDWQCKVLELIDENKSVVVCAPTSSGKTVLSTYTVVKIAQDAAAGGVLFCVPSEPLVWQVASMFENLMPGQVAFATDLLSYRPTQERGQSKIVVGTPEALESALSKVRGLVGAEVAKGHDFMQLQGGFQYNYAVFDEVHSLDGEEGGALQRLMHLIECPFLALSATIGNADELSAFWSQMRTTHKDCVPVLSSPNDPNVALIRHEGRFINLQRYYLTPSTAVRGALVRSVDMAKTTSLEQLHPCAALTLELLREKSFAELSISFTPRDSLALWKAFEKHITDQRSVEHLHPKTFFEKYGPEGSHQITLEEAKEYETALKQHMEAMAKDDAQAAQVQALIGEFTVDESTLSTSTQLYEFATKCKEQDLFPCLCFQLDSFKCLELYKDLLGTLESRQRVEFPNHYRDLELKAEEEARRLEFLREEEQGRRRGGAADDGDMKEDMQMSIDTAAPHDEYVLSRPKSRISTLDFEEIQEELKKDGEELPANHPLMRGLRRGIGIYINDFTAAGYRRIVQRLAQEGKLAMVFSDHSLAYGVNMPFRTCAFCGDMGGLLTPLMAQQMSGRTGRRGLDTQGNIVYLGMPMTDIKNLILGQIPDITGVEPLYPTMALQPILSEFVDTRVGRNTSNVTLKDFRTATAEGDEALTRAVARGGAYFDMSQKLMQELNIIDDNMDPVGGANMRTGLTTCFEMRDVISESLVILYCLPKFRADFHAKVKEVYKDDVQNIEHHAEKTELQIEFFSKLLHVIDRRAPYRGVPGLDDTPFHLSSYVTKYERQGAWDEWEQLIQASQDRYESLSPGLKAELNESGAMDLLRLPSPPEGLDCTVFEVIKNNLLPLTLSSAIKHSIKQRLTYVGTVLMKMHNCLCQPGQYEDLEPILRKCFKRVKYIIEDSTKNETKLDEHERSASAAAEAEASN